MVHSSQKFQYNKFMNELKKDIAKVDKVILEEQEDKRSKAPPLWYNEQHLRNLQYITPKEAMSLPQITLKH